MEMTRIEVFVDAAFAFAVTMLVISFDAIPGNWDEIITAFKSVPAFVIAVVQLVWIWHEHSVWSRRYGLDDIPTVILSTALLIVMLVYVYPMRIMASGMFGWLTNGYLPSNFDLNSYEELSGMFVLLGIGFSAICGVFVLMYSYAARQRSFLLLSAAELHETRTIAQFWAGALVVGLLVALAAVRLPPPWTPIAGFVFCLLAVWGPFIGITRNRSKPQETD
jgi:uncharacterized membrane protein